MTNEQRNINLNVNISHSDMANPDNDKFLFYFTPNSLARESCCGCSLKTGVQVVALVFMAAALSNFFSAIRNGFIFDLIVGGLAFTLYFVAGAILIYSTMSYGFIYAHTAYIIYALIFIINSTDNLVVFLLIILGIYSPFGDTDSFKSGIVFLVALAIILAFNLYLIWIVFSYSIHLKHNRFQLIAGNIFYKYDEVSHENRNFVQNNVNNTGSTMPNQVPLTSPIPMNNIPMTNQQPTLI